MAGLFSLASDVEKADILCKEIVQMKELKAESTEIVNSFLCFYYKNENKMQYVVMCVEDGKMKRVFLDQSTTYIVETDEKPRIEYNGIKRTWPAWRTLPCFWDKVEEWYSDDGATIFVPHGTVAVKFDEI
jgi:hypothetical protein